MTDDFSATRAQQNIDHKTPLWVVCGICVWAAGCLAGSLLLIDYSVRPSAIVSDDAVLDKTVLDGTGNHLIGQATETLQQGPANSLLVFLHPKCPCSRATLRELRKLLAKSHSQVSLQFHFFIPSGVDATWAESDLWRHASLFANATLATDVGGKNAAAYGARASGHMVLFSSNGRREFAGGITSGRGHEGSNPAQASLFSLLKYNCEGKANFVRSFPVFGCVIEEPVCCKKDVNDVQG